MSTTVNADAIDAIANDLKSNRLIVLAGAGVSAAPPACVPLFRPLRDLLLKALIQSVRGSLSEKALLECSQLFAPDTPLRRGNEPVPEVLFDSLYPPLREELFVALRLLLNADNPNPQHEFLSAMLGRGVRLLITTNFEECFEKALAMKGKSYVVHTDGQAMLSSAKAMVSQHNSRLELWKIHGSLETGRESSIRITLSQVAQERYDQNKFSAVVEACKQCPILVLGYSGYDADVSQSLVAAAKHGRMIYWLSLRQPQESEPPHTILAAWRDRAHLLVCDIVTLFNELSKRFPEAGLFSRPVGNCDHAAALREEKITVWAKTLPPKLRLFALSTLTWRLGAYDASVEVVSQLEATAQRENDYDAVIAALFLRAGVLRDAGKFDELEKLAKTLTMSKEAVEASGETLDDFTLRNILMIQGAVAESRSDFGDAERKYRQAKALPAPEGSQRETDQALAALLSKTGWPAEAKSLLDNVLSSAKRIGHREAELKARHEAAILAHAAGNHGMAEELHNENLLIAREIGSVNLECIICFELGNIALHNHRNYVNARRYYSESLTLAERLGLHRSILSSLFGLADIDQEQELHLEAVAGFTKCVALAQRINDLEILCFALTRRARSYALHMDFARSKSDLDAVFPLARKLGLPIIAEIESLRRLVDMMVR